MTDKHKLANRVARQTKIDDSLISPVWGAKVDEALIARYVAFEHAKSPFILLPELRFRSFLTALSQRLTKPSKLMIVDHSNVRFEGFREAVEPCAHHLYFSSQEICALNYSDDSFHDVITQAGLPTLSRAEVVFSSYRRVLKPGGHFLCSMPLVGSFPAFFDLFEECLFRLNPQKCEEMMAQFRANMTLQACQNAISQSGFVLDEVSSLSFDIELPNVESLLFSTLAESHYLGYCLQLADSTFDSKALLTLVVNAFHHYFQGLAVHLPQNIGIFVAHKPV